MQVSVEKLTGLKRKLNILVPAETLAAEVNSRLKKIAPTVNMHGFRAGKAPFSAVKKKYMRAVWDEVAREMVEPTLRDALVKHELTPAETPYVDLEVLEVSSDFKYSATFDVFPENMQVNELDNAKVDIIESSVQDEDVERILERLRSENKVWHDVERAAVDGDKLEIDFEGFLDDKPFAGGSADNMSIIIGSKRMIPGFEEAFIGAEKGKPFEFNICFPADYHEAKLAGKDTKFKVVINKIMEGSIPALDNAFAESMNIKEGGVTALRQDIKDNMIRELERNVSIKNRRHVFDKLREHNKIELPQSLIEREIKHLQHEMYHKLFGNEHSEHEKIPDFPRELFEEDATRRVHVGLLFAEYVKKHALVVDKERVDAMINKMAGAYEDPAELRAWYYEKDERVAEVEALVLEEIVVEKILENATIVKKTMCYDEVVNAEAR